MNISSLSAARQRLVQLMQQIVFGSIKNLRVERGDPSWDSPPEVIRDLVLGKANDSHQPVSEDFALKQKIVDLFDLFDNRQTLNIERIDVQGGLPFRVTIREAVGV